jgi:hypothetical protein
LAVWGEIRAEVPENTSTYVGAREEQATSGLGERVVVFFVLHPANA